MRLTLSNRSFIFSPSRILVFLRPQTISKIITPKLNTSDLIENSPCLIYSGAIYPLYTSKRRYSIIKLKKMKIENIFVKCFFNTYYVPIIVLVMPCVCLAANNLAMPKSVIFGFISSSRRILLVLRSR